MPKIRTTETTKHNKSRADKILRNDNKTNALCLCLYHRAAQWQLHKQNSVAVWSHHMLFI